MGSRKITSEILCVHTVLMLHWLPSPLFPSPSWISVPISGPFPPSCAASSLLSIVQMGCLFYSRRRASEVSAGGACGGVFTTGHAHTQVHPIIVQGINLYSYYSQFARPISEKRRSKLTNQICCTQWCI